MRPEYVCMGKEKRDITQKYCKIIKEQQLLKFLQTVCKMHARYTLYDLLLVLFNGPHLKEG